MKNVPSVPEFPKRIEKLSHIYVAKVEEMNKILTGKNL